MTSLTAEWACRLFMFMNESSSTPKFENFVDVFVLSSVLEYE